MAQQTHATNKAAVDDEEEPSPEVVEGTSAVTAAVVGAVVGGTTAGPAGAATGAVFGASLGGATMACAEAVFGLDGHESVAEVKTLPGTTPS